MTENREGTGFWSGFDSNARLLRFLVAAAGVIAPFLVFAYFTVGSLGFEFAGTKVQVSLKGEVGESDTISDIVFSNGGLQLSTSSGSTFATMLLPGNLLWFNTGINVNPGDCVQLQASGSIDLSQNQTLAINADPGKFSPENQYYFLVDPFGNRLDSGLSGPPLARKRDADDFRSSLKLSPDDALGTVIATIVSRSEMKVIDKEPRQGEMFSILDATSGHRYEGKKTGVLLISVNDLLPIGGETGRNVWLLKTDSEGKLLSEAEWKTNVAKAYSIPMSEVSERIRLLNRLWDSASRNYLRFFYEDNGGYYMVGIAVLRNRKSCV